MLNTVNRLLKLQSQISGIKNLHGTLIKLKSFALHKSTQEVLTYVQRITINLNKLTGNKVKVSEAKLLFLKLEADALIELNLLTKDYPTVLPFSKTMLDTSKRD